MRNLEKKLDELLQDSVSEYKLPGISLMLHIEKGSWLLRNKTEEGAERFAYEGTAGYKDVETKEPLSEDHVFHMASVTKLFTATAVMQLWEQGKLSLDEPLVDIIPELKRAPEEFSKITIHHLLTHTSGLGNVEEFRWDSPRIAEAALENYMLSREITEHPFQEGEKGKSFYYSDIGYEFLGVVIQRKTGQSLEGYIEEHILRPLKMDHSTLLTFERSMKLPQAEHLRASDGSWNLEDRQLGKALMSRQLLGRLPLAMAHGRDKDGNPVPEVYPYNREHGASSTLTSTPRDMQRFAASHLAHATGSAQVPQLLQPDTYAQIWKPYALVPNNGEHMGLSWFIRRQGDHIFYGHEGMDDGFRASFWICPELFLTVLVNSNVTKAPTKRVMKKAVDMVLDSLL